MSWYASPESRLRPTDLPGSVYPPPLWSLSDSVDKEAIARHLAIELQTRPNHEANSPPLYYALAAAWYKLGRLAGMDAPRTAYWVRFLNIPLCVALVVATFGFCRAYFPWWVALAAPMLAALFPSNMVFCVGSDVLSPLAVLVALWLILRWDADPTNARRSVAAGLAAAAAVLVKLSNVPVLAACGGVVLLRAFRGAPRAATATVPAPKRAAGRRLGGAAACRLAVRAIGWFSATGRAMPQSSAFWAGT